MLPDSRREALQFFVMLRFHDFPGFLGRSFCFDDKNVESGFAASEIASLMLCWGRLRCVLSSATMPAVSSSFFLLTPDNDVLRECRQLKLEGSELGSYIRG